MILYQYKNNKNGGNMIYDEMEAFVNKCKLLLAGDTETLKEHYNIENDGNEVDFTHIYGTEIFETPKQISGFMMDRRYGVDKFRDDDAYTDLIIAYGGPSCRLILGTNGDAFMHFQGGLGEASMVVSLGRGHENSELYELVCDYLPGFSDNQFDCDEDERTLRKIADLAVESFDEYANSNISDIALVTMTIKGFKEAASNNNWNIEETIIDLIDKGYIDREVYDVETDSYYKTTTQMVMGDIESIMKEIDKLSLKSDYDDVVEVFGFDSQSLTELDYDFTESVINEAFKPTEQKKRNTLKP